MADLYYTLDSFAGTLPNGMASPARGNHRVGLARLIWAATTIGSTPFGPRLHEGRALEVQWRAAMMRASIEASRTYFERSARYARLDPSEKGAVSFFLGQAQAKLFAHDFFRVSRFVHYDAYLAHLGIPRRRTRPDFIGFHGGNIAIAVEAKGRSLGYDGTLVARAKKQVGSLPDIRGHPITATYAHVAYFDHDRWCAYLADPPAQSRTGLIDPVRLTAAYYIPIVNAIRARREREPIRLSQTEGSYIRAYFAEVDLYLSVLADIEAMTPTDNTAGSRGADDFTGGLLYERVLRLDEETGRFHRTPPQDDREFLGSDGVAVELGPSWTRVAASSSFDPGDTVA